MKAFKSFKFVAMLVAAFVALSRLMFGVVATQRPPVKPAAKPTAPKPAPAKAALPTVTVLGRLGGDAEVKFVGADAKMVVEFNIAEDHYTGEKDAQNKFVKTTTWARVSCWGKIAERAQFLTKGQEIVVRGRLKVTAGEKREFHDITADVIRITAPLPEPEEAPEEEMPG